MNFMTTFEDFWQTLPKRIRELTELSYIYRYHWSHFDVYFKDRAIPKGEFLYKQIFLDYAEGKYLDQHGKEADVARLNGEEDDVYRERIRFKLMIDRNGLTVQTVKDYLYFRTGYEVELIDEYTNAGRIVSEETQDFQPNNNYIINPQYMYARWYIRYWDAPPVESKTLYNTLRYFIEPYVNILLCQYQTGEAVAKIVKYYCDNFTVVDINKEEQVYPKKAKMGSWIHSAAGTMLSPTENSRATLNRQIYQVKLYESPDIFFKDLKKEIERRLPDIEVHLGFGDEKALFDNFIDGDYSIKNSTYPIGYYIVSAAGYGKILDVDGKMRTDPMDLKKQYKKNFGKDITVLDPLSKKAKEVISVPHKLYYGSSFGGWIHSNKKTTPNYMNFDYSPYIVSEGYTKNIIIKLLEPLSDSEKETITAELKAVNNEKKYIFTGA